MGREFRIFLVCLLGFCVLVGAFLIVWPLVTGGPAEPVISAPPPEQPEQPPADSPPPASGEAEESPPDSHDGPGVAEFVETPPAYAPEVQALLAGMTLEEKVFQLFIVTPEALTGVETATVAGDMTREALERQPVGGVVYFAGNLIDRRQTMELLEKTQSYSEIPLFLAVDEEGGRVARVGSNPALGTTAFSDMADYGEDGNPRAVYEIGAAIGRELLELGFNLDFAPVADVVTNPDNTEIGPRAFSSDPSTAAQMVGSFVSGMRESGMLSTLKHFPGHGGTSADSHDGLSVTERTLEEMRQSELLPFQAGLDAGAPLVMVGHLSAVALNGDHTPSSLSSAVVTDLLRGELGFTGVVITDALNMGAITDHYSPATAAVGALKAGADMLLIPEDFPEAVEGVLEALEDGRLTEARIDESILRILSAKLEYGLLR